jgi:hypothetical protein
LTRRPCCALSRDVAATAMLQADIAPAAIAPLAFEGYRSADWWRSETHESRKSLAPDSREVTQTRMGTRWRFPVAYRQRTSRVRRQSGVFGTYLLGAPAPTV